MNGKLTWGIGLINQTEGTSKTFETIPCWQSLTSIFEKKVLKNFP